MKCPKRCRDCQSLWNKGLLKKNWCCHYSRLCHQALGMCKLRNGKTYVSPIKRKEDTHM
jgi:hypothetical protein